MPDASTRTVAIAPLHRIGPCRSHSDRAALRIVRCRDGCHVCRPTKWAGLKPSTRGPPALSRPPPAATSLCLPDLPVQAGDERGAVRLRFSWSARAPEGSASRFSPDRHRAGDGLGSHGNRVRGPSRSQESREATDPVSHHTAAAPAAGRDVIEDDIRLGDGRRRTGARRADGSRAPRHSRVRSLMSQNRSRRRDGWPNRVILTASDARRVDAH
jgi:hypothetical protein